MGILIAAPFGSLIVGGCSLGLVTMVAVLVLIVVLFSSLTFGLSCTSFRSRTWGVVRCMLLGCAMVDCCSYEFGTPACKKFIETKRKRNEGTGQTTRRLSAIRNDNKRNEHTIGKKQQNNMRRTPGKQATKRHDWQRNDSRCDFCAGM